MTNEHPETIFKYRLIETTYKQRIEWEDGPGTLRNIVSDVSERIVKIWLGNKNISRYIYPNQPDGWVDYSYHVERKAKGAYAWEHDRFVDKSTEGRKVYYDYPDYTCLDEYLAPLLPETEWEEPEYRCCTCNVLVTPDVHECAECATAFYELVRPRCCECKQPVAGSQMLCDECAWEFFVSDMKELFGLSVFHREWWGLLHDILRFTDFKQILQRVRR